MTVLSPLVILFYVFAVVYISFEVCIHCKSFVWTKINAMMIMSTVKGIIYTLGNIWSTLNE